MLIIHAHVTAILVVTLEMHWCGSSSISSSSSSSGIGSGSGSSSGSSSGGGSGSGNHIVISIVGVVVAVSSYTLWGDGTTHRGLEPVSTTCTPVAT